MKLRGRAEQEILKNSNQTTSIAELALVSPASPEDTNTILAKLLSRHDLKLAPNRSLKLAHAA